ncbi:MAG: hypothetical protein ACHWZW_21265 [Spirulina sp.]
MTISEWLAQAKEGDAKAIAALLNQSLKPKGIQVRAERDSYCLNLWMTGNALPPQPQLVDYLRRAIERLQLDSVGILRIEAHSTADPSQSWTTEMALLAGRVQPESGIAKPITSEPQTSGIGPSEPSPSDRHSSEASEMAEPKMPEPNAPELAPASDLEPGTDSLPADIARAYQELGLSPGAPLAEIESTYFKTKAALLRQGNRAALEPLKWAFTTLKDYTKTQASLPKPDPAETDNPEVDPQTHGGGAVPGVDPVLTLQALLKEQDLPGQVVRQGNQVHIRWRASQVTNPKQITKQLYVLLTQQDLLAMGLGDVPSLVVAVLDDQNQVVWRQVLTMPKRPWWKKTPT